MTRITVFSEGEIDMLSNNQVVSCTDPDNVKHIYMSHERWDAYVAEINKEGESSDL